MDECVIYTTQTCPRCKMLKELLKKAGIPFVENDSITEMEQLGIKNVPILKVGNQMMNFLEAVKWINK